MLAASLQTRTAPAQRAATRARVAAVRPTTSLFSGRAACSRREAARWVVARAEEAQAPAAEAEVSDAAAAAEPQAAALPAQPEPSPMERARAALEDDDLDRAALGGALNDLEAELEDLRGAAAAAATSAAAAATAEAALDRSKDQYLRLQADFDNFRRRTATEKEGLAAKATCDVVGALLPLLDNFELARTQLKAETEGEEKINASYQGLYKQTVDILKGLGVEPVPTVGTPFDPALHDAIAREASDDVADGTVLTEFRKGFELKGTLIRPAMVKVSYTDAPAEASVAETVEEVGGGVTDEDGAAAAAAE